MSKLREITARATLISVVAVMVMGTASALALMDKIDGQTYFGLALLVAGALFKANEAKA